MSSTALPPLTSNSDIERLVQLDFLRATEAAALNVMQWVGKGQKEAADEAACDAIRGMFDLMNIRGEVFIGEGIKDNAPGIFKGERIGTWREGTPSYAIALDPVDGTTNCSKGMPNSISCIAAVSRDEQGRSQLLDIPAYYLKKLSYPQAVRKVWMADRSLPLNPDAPIEEVIKLVARVLGKEIRDVVVMVLDRPRNASYVEDIRRCGASLRMIADGDITAALAPALPGSGVDIYCGIGGTTEGVLAAAALRCLGGGMQSKIWTHSEAERQELIAGGWGPQLDKTFLSRDLAYADEIIFCATGITDSPLLKGVSVKGHTATTHSVLMRAKTNTVRFLETHHNLECKTIHLRSTSKEVLLNPTPGHA
jgi:fructose-1,6-bisphosphatase II